MTASDPKFVDDQQLHDRSCCRWRTLNPEPKMRVTLAQLTLRLPPDSRYVLLMADKAKAAVGAQLQKMTGGFMLQLEHGGACRQ